MPFRWSSSCWKTREQLVGFYGDLVSFKVATDQMNLLRPHDRPVQIGDRQAAFLVLPFAARFDDLRVDDGLGSLAYVVDENPAFNAHLRGCETDAGCVTHRLDHLLGEADDLAVDLIDLRHALAQDGVAEHPNRKDRHGATLALRGPGVAEQPAPKTPFGSDPLGAVVSRSGPAAHRPLQPKAAQA